MNPTHLHLLLNHVPVLGPFFALGLLIVASRQKSEALTKIALGSLVVFALLAVPVYLTGEPAEDVAKPLPGVTKAFMEAHEEAAEIGFTGMVVLGTGALAGLVWFRRGKAIPNWFTLAMIAASLVVSGLMAWTANLGGQIRHTEIRSGAVISR